MSKIEGKFRPFEVLCHGVIALLRPMTAPIELLLHVEVGERYAALSGPVALLLMGAWSHLTRDSGLIVLLMLAFALRLAINKLLCLRNRRRGRVTPHTRSPGKPLLSQVMGIGSVRILTWIEPLIALMLAVALRFVTPAAALYLTCSALCLLGANTLHGWVSYHRRLDAMDRELERSEQALQVLEGQSPAGECPLLQSRELPQRAQRVVVKRRGFVGGIVLRPHEVTHRP